LKKRLDTARFCTYFGASNTIAFALRFCTGAPAPNHRKLHATPAKDY
jgi:hypothetical protein